MEFYVALCPYVHTVGKIKRFTGQRVYVRLWVHVHTGSVFANRGILIQVCVCRSLHVYLCMYIDVCAIVYVSLWPLLWPFLLNAWVLNYSWLCVCAFVCVWICGSNNQPPAPNPNTCSPINMQRAGAHLLTSPSFYFLPIFPAPFLHFLPCTKASLPFSTRFYPAFYCFTFQLLNNSVPVCFRPFSLSNFAIIRWCH